MTDTVCGACGRTERSGLLCATCMTQIRRALTAIPELVEDLAITLARQARTTTTQGRSTTPAQERDHYDATASDTATHLTATLTTWATAIGHPAWYATTAAQQLLNHLDQLRHHPDADKAHTELTTAVHAARRAIDLPPGRRIHVGPCPQDGCAGTIRAWLPTEETRPARLSCDTTPEHAWDATQWYRLGQRILHRMGAA